MFLSTVPSLIDVNTQCDECQDDTRDFHRWSEPDRMNYEGMQYQNRVHTVSVKQMKVHVKLMC